jgi:hypothetical protein
MIIRILNPDISQNEKTYLSADVSAGNTSLSVQNNEGITAADYFVVGIMGTEQTELVTVSSVSGSTTVVTSALKFPHSIDAPLTFIKYNQIFLYSATSKTGTYTLVGSAVTIEVDQEFTEIEDTAGTSSTWYKIRYRNATTAEFSDYSDVVEGTGYEDNSVLAIMDRIYIIGNDPERKALPEDDMLIILNDGYRKLISRVMQDNHKFYLKKGYVDVVNSYDTGTVSVTDGSPTVTGVSTVWTSAMVGRVIQFGNEGYSYDIDAASATSITLSQNYNGGGSDLSSSSYIIYQNKYDIYDDSDDTVVDDLKKIEMVVNEDGGEVLPFDLHRNLNGYYLERSGDNLKFCLNYKSDTTLNGGKWTVWYLYQPPKLDSMADVPELPLGFDSVLQAYGLQRLYERMGDSTKARIYEGQFIQDANSMIRYGSHRTNKPKSFRLPSRYSSKIEEEPLDNWTTD